MRYKYFESKIDKEYYKTRIDELPMMYDYHSEFAMDEKGDNIFNIIHTNFDFNVKIDPNHLRAYILLKMEDPRLALLYIEDLLAFSITGTHITDNLVVRAIMEIEKFDLYKQYKKRFGIDLFKYKLKKFFKIKDTIKFV